ncbi:MAG: hypothetical protein JW940_24800 [Polyangiaceae bacterium]|nr:hypothetical protein [Polyangiaceae bacterium]
MILQTCSGRNLGPGVFVDSYLAGFVLSHDMIRVEVEQERLRNFLIAFLNSHTGRHLLRRDKTGSVIDHISVEHLERVEVVLLPPAETDEVSAMIGKAIRLRERARIGLAEMLKAYSQSLPPIRRRKQRHEGWDVGSTALCGRLDAAYHDPLVAEIRRKLRKRGGVRVGEVARVLKPGGRYKTRYVAAANGRPLLSGGQLLQTYPINLQHMSPGVFKDVADYELRRGWVAYPADGRAEEELGRPVLITPHRDGWLASGHVGRIEPLRGVNPGSLFLALATEHA